MLAWRGGRRLNLTGIHIHGALCFQSQVVGNNDASYVVGGRYEFGDVSGLRLFTETTAGANVTWTVVLNDLGKLFSLTNPPSGNAAVIFDKKPDGTWFLEKQSNQIDNPSSSDK
jgi:hypothetical protein